MLSKPQIACAHTKDVNLTDVLLCTVKSVRLGVVARVFRAWADATANSGVRSRTLYGLLKSLDCRWQRRFYKNHFMAWRFMFMQVRISFCTFICF
jgi:hypothetical protein